MELVELVSIVVDGDKTEPIGFEKHPIAIAVTVTIPKTVGKNEPISRVSHGLDIFLGEHMRVLTITVGADEQVVKHVKNFIKERVTV